MSYESMKLDSIGSSVLSRRTCLTLGMGAAAWGVLSPTVPWAQAARPGDDPSSLSLKQASDLIRSGAASPLDLTRACLNRIDRYNSTLNAFITVARNGALARATELEAELARGQWRGPLHGIPIAVKDTIDTAGLRTTGGSELFSDRIPVEDAEVVRRLSAAGAILLGKLNLHEFGYGGTSTVTHYGTVHNPWDLDRVTGGSSGGSAAAVAADLCYAALGTDTAGSVRIPAAHCGVVGLKPTHGRVGIRGVFPMSALLDHVGPLCKTVEDTALMLNVMAGYDPRDATSLDRPVPDYSRDLGMPTGRLRLGIPGAPYYDDLDSEVAEALQAAIVVLRGLTAGTREVRLPNAISGARLWGPEAYAFHKEWVTQSPERYQPSTRASLERYANAAALDYIRARQEVEAIRREIGSVFAEVDLVITPVMRVPAPLLADGGGSGSSANSAAFNVFGLPALSVPCGFTRSGLPIGLQIAGAHHADATVLALAHAYEQATAWHLRKPDLQ